MSLENIEKGNIKFAFKRFVTVEEFDQILNSYTGELPETPEFWKEYHEFGEHVLMSLIEHKTFTLTIKDNYEYFVPTMKRYFLTDEEYETIVKNVGFMKKDINNIYKDTPIYKIYNMMKMWGTYPTMSELLKMNYKTFLKIYLYSIGDRFIIPLKPKAQDYVQ